MLNFTYNLMEINKIAHQICPLILSNKCLVFTGDIGIGKTTLIRELLGCLGFQNFLGSPTFALINTYRNSQYLVYHMDFYRLKGVEELGNLDLEYYMRDGRCWIEWGERFSEYLPEQYGQLSINYVDELRRDCSFANHDKSLC